MAPARPVKLLEQPGAVALGSAWSTTTLVALTHEGTTTVVVPASATTPRVETDGGLVLVVHEAGALRAVTAHDATREHKASTRYAEHRVVHGSSRGARPLHSRSETREGIRC